MRTRSLVACTLLVLSILAAGCGFKDVDKRFFVVELGIDKSKDAKKPFQVTFKVAIPTPVVEPGKTKSQILTRTASSVPEATRLMQSDVDKEIDYGHLKAVIFGKDVASSPELFVPAMDWVFRNADIQSITYVALGVPNASEVVEHQTASERYPGNAINLALSEDGAESPYIVPQMLTTFIADLTEIGKDPYLPVVQNIQDSSRIDHVVIINEQQELKATLTPQQSAWMQAFIHGNKDMGLFFKYKDEDIALRLGNVSASYSISATRNGRPVIKAKVTSDATITSAYVGIFQENMKPVEEAAQKEVNKQVQQLLRKLHKANVDPLGFGLKYVATHYHREKDYEDWKEMYPDLEFEVTSKISITGAGLTK